MKNSTSIHRLNGFAVLCRFIDIEFYPEVGGREGSAVIEHCSNLKVSAGLVGQVF
jgi:hypothetical protein